MNILNLKQDKGCRKVIDANFAVYPRAAEALSESGFGFQVPQTPQGTSLCTQTSCVCVLVEIPSCLSRAGIMIRVKDALRHLIPCCAPTLRSIRELQRPYPRGDSGSWCPKSLKERLSVHRSAVVCVLAEIPSCLRRHPDTVICVRYTSSDVVVRL